MRLVQPATVETIQGIVKTLKDSFGFIERADVEKDVRFFTAHFLSHSIVQSALFIPLLFFPTCESVLLLICMWNIFNTFLTCFCKYTLYIHMYSFHLPPPFLSVCLQIFFHYSELSPGAESEMAGGACVEFVIQSRQVLHTYIIQTNNSSYIH